MDAAAQQPQQLNYRQIGKRVEVGSLCRGFVSSPAAGGSSKTAASIPSRFETVINSSQRESRAFGSQATRFRSNEVRTHRMFSPLSSAAFLHFLECRILAMFYF